MRTEHIGALGSVDVAVSVRERLTFWAQLPERLTRLGNRIGSKELPEIYAALHSRVPMVTPEEQRAIQEENAKDDERFWDAIRDIGASSIDGNKGLIANAEKAIADETSRVAAAAGKGDAARRRLARLARGESVPGGLGKKLDVVAAMKAEGVTRRQMKRMVLLTELTEGELSSVARSARVANAHDGAIDREVRRLLREKKLPTP